MSNILEGDWRMEMYKFVGPYIEGFSREEFSQDPFYHIVNLEDEKDYFSPNLPNLRNFINLLYRACDEKREIRLVEKRIVKKNDRIFPITVSEKIIRNAK